MNIMQMSISAGIFIIAIVIMRAIALNKLPKNTFLILWGIALIRLLIPVSIPSQFSIYTVFSRLFKGNANVAENTIANIVQPNHFLIPVEVSNQLVEPAVQSRFAEVSISSIIWLIGAIILFVFFTVIHIRNCKELRFSLPIHNHDLINEWSKEHKIKRTITILQSDRITTPLAVGLIKPRIILPKSMNIEDKELLQYVLTHEYYHIKRFDVLSKTILTIALCLHWFNPLVWIMLILMNRDIELTCDEKVVCHFGTDTKFSYAYSLIRMAEQRSKLTPLHSGFSKNAAEERITSIMKIKKTSIVSAITSLSLLVGITFVFATTGVSAESEKKVTETSTEESTDTTRESMPIYVDFDSIDASAEVKSSEIIPAESQIIDQARKASISEDTAKKTKTNEIAMLLTAEKQSSKETVYIPADVQKEINSPEIMQTEPASSEETVEIVNDVGQEGSGLICICGDPTCNLADIPESFIDKTVQEPNYNFDKIQEETTNSEEDDAQLPTESVIFIEDSHDINSTYDLTVYQEKLHNENLLAAILHDPIYAHLLKEGE